MASSNREMIAEVARCFGPLLGEVVFVGGATTELLVTRPLAYDIRVTKDIDVIIEAVNRTDYYRFADRLRERGFREVSEAGHPICRWSVEGQLIDIMPTDETILGFSNRWYPDAIANAAEYVLEEQVAIRVVTPPYFLATKYEAFLGRGEDDLYASHDIEDIFTLIDGRPSVPSEIKESPKELKAYLSEAFTVLSGHQDFEYAVAGQFPGGEVGRERAAELLQSIESIARISRPSNPDSPLSLKRITTPSQPKTVEG